MSVPPPVQSKEPTSNTYVVDDHLANPRIDGARVHGLSIDADERAISGSVAGGMSCFRTDKAKNNNVDELAVAPRGGEAERTVDRW